MSPSGPPITNLPVGLIKKFSSFGIQISGNPDLTISITLLFISELEAASSCWVETTIEEMPTGLSFLYLTFRLKLA